MSLFPPIRRVARLALVAAILVTPLAFAQSLPGVSYTITLVSPAQHLVEVQIILPAGAAQRELQLPVWNALYQVRDFAQYVNWVRAKDRSGGELAVRVLSKSCWQIEDAAGGAVVEYQIYVDSPGPFGAQFNAHHAFLNLAQVLMYPADLRHAPMRVRFNQVPDTWRIATPLSLGADDQFEAEDYDRLVDSPVEISSFRESDFEEDGGHFRVIVDADVAEYNMESIVSQLHKIVAAATSWMNDRPFDTYTFIYHFPHGPGGGGMEHSFSTAIDINAESMKSSPETLAGISAHEFFHLWNVKRIRPQTLEPIDYTKENYTRALWFSEGVTSTVEGILQLRAGLLDEKQYLQRVSELMAELERRPAHLTQSAEESSLDAWLEGDAYYRRPERSISYYNKGELLGIMLDLAIRDASHGQASLRDVFEWMNVNYAKKAKFFKDSEGVREAAEAVSHSDLGWFFAKYVTGTEEIPWNDFLRSVGLRAQAITVSVADAGFLASRNFDGPMSVSAVTPGSDAERAGLQVGDAIVELQGNASGQDARQELARLNPGDTLRLRVRGRRGNERELKWKVASRQEISYEVGNLDQVTDTQLARRAAWIKGEDQPTASAAGEAGTDVQPGSRMSGSQKPDFQKPGSQKPESQKPEFLEK